MNHEPGRKNQKDADPKTASETSVGAQSLAASEPTTDIAPELSTYFGEPKVSPQKFLKALRTSKVGRFGQADEVRALELMRSADADGDRLWALMSQVRVPEALERWIWKIVPERLRHILGEDLDLNDGDTTSIFKSVRASLAPELRSGDKARVRRAETWLRIAICWLIARRSLDQWQVIEQLRPLFFGRQADSIRAAAKVLQRGRSSEFRQAIAVGGLADSVVANARSERDIQTQIASDLRQEILVLRQRLDGTQSELERTTAHLASATRTLDSVRAELDIERHHRGHELAETKAKQKALLRGRLAPLLSDAIDALEIEPPAPHVALKRLKNVVALIDEESQ